jgi:hypothetical protein
VSTNIMVLVFSELNCFVRKILQGEENKGVEITGEGNPAVRAGEVNSRQFKVESKGS